MGSKLVWITPNAEQVITDCARVSNPSNQGKDGTKLIKYLIDHDHWSPFEIACACVEIKTYRGIVPQILRHRSFHFQEFSQRYATVSKYLVVNPRRQDDKNRQNSIDDLDVDTKRWFYNAMDIAEKQAVGVYEEALRRGIAKESARFILPANAMSVLYMQGTIRDWIHYLRVRTKPDVQKEHRDIATAIGLILAPHIPTIISAMEEAWLN